MQHESTDQDRCVSKPIRVRRNLKNPWPIFVKNPIGTFLKSGQRPTRTRADMTEKIFDRPRRSGPDRVRDLRSRMNEL